MNLLAVSVGPEIADDGSIVVLLSYDDFSTFQMVDGLALFLIMLVKYSFLVVRSLVTTRFLCSLYSFQTSNVLCLRNLLWIRFSFLIAWRMSYITQGHLCLDGLIALKGACWLTTSSIDDSRRKFCPHCHQICQ